MYEFKNRKSTRFAYAFIQQLNSLFGRPFSVARLEAQQAGNKEERKAQFVGHGALIRAEPRFTPISLSRGGGRSSVKRRPGKQAASTALLSVSRSLRTRSKSTNGDSPSQLLGLAWYGQGQRPGRRPGECQGHRRGEREQ